MTKAENIVTGICGHKGSGKTTLLTFFLISEIEQEIKNKCFCNYSLKIPFTWLNAYDMIEHMEIFENSTIGIDELHEYADSRSSGTLQNKRIADFFLQSRHTSSNVYYTSQFIDQIDKRIRRITDIEVLCENLHIDTDNDGDDDLFRFTIYDTRTLKFEERMFYAKPIFSMYDSKERINPFMISKEREKEIKKNISDKNEQRTNTT